MASPRANLVIAGVTKAGSTALLHYLGQHPAICAERLKEAQPLLAHTTEEAIDRAYEQQFAHARGEPFRLEASPAYVTAGPGFPATLDRRLPGARILVTLRDPVDRIWSGYKMKQSKGLVPPGSFDDFVDRGLSGTETDRRFQVFDTSRYVAWLPDWLTRFDERILILWFDDLSEDTVGTLRKVCAWLSLDARHVDSFELAVHNRSLLHRSERLQRVASRLNHVAALPLKGQPRAKDALVQLYERVNGIRITERMTPETRARLQEHFEPHNRRLAELLLARGMADLPAWVTADHASTGAVTETPRRT